MVSSSIGDNSPCIHNPFTISLILKGLGTIYFFSKKVTNTNEIKRKHY